ncbi:hypothetical protein Q73A0000_06645 [Kaistella flava (ex Peng et al. 2021)]|uniref:Lipoprotein n=1 Tax=Kaistella flava (ex Peng et al. 2021) TaxID=2038776 RepID=A0A7M2Y8S0_9FLAO|nr:hypothetical protein [Kaistella flava (ex Peng et al. 2021)]QOW10064.1 hypothetical protein Q73A0000_06645 [Kaistella flava (ex Peng et al. 2021)]
MRNLIYTGVLFSMLLSCDRDSVKTVDPNFAIESVMYIYVNDDAGKNLIGTANYNEETIKVTYEEPSSPSQDKKYVLLTDLNGNKFIKLFLNLGSHDSLSSTTLVKWNENNQDLLRAEISKNNNSAIVEKVYLGDDLICPDRDHMTVTLIK